VIGFPGHHETDYQVQQEEDDYNKKKTSSRTAGTTTRRNDRRSLYRDESGSKTVLVVYVRDQSGGKPDKNPSGFENSIEDDVFGTHGDKLNLANVVRHFLFSSFRVFLIVFVFAYAYLYNLKMHTIFICVLENVTWVFEILVL
jgi:hypothetical protein